MEMMEPSLISSVSPEREIDLESLSDRDIKELFFEGLSKYSGKYPEHDSFLPRAATVLGFLDQLFKGNLAGKKVIDVGAGSSRLANKLTWAVYHPLLAEILTKEGGKVLAVDKDIRRADADGFEFLNSDLKDFRSDNLPADWQKADVVVSTAFLGQPSGTSDVDPFRLIGELSKVAEYQVHNINPGEEGYVADALDSDELKAAGLEVLYNGLESMADKSGMGSVLILRKKLERKLN